MSGIQDIVRRAKSPKTVAADLIKYDYRGLEGDLSDKKAILLRLCDALEPRREQLKGLSKDLASDLFFVANNLNIRHNNLDPSCSSNYRPAVAQVGERELEGWYDLFRDMCAAAFLLLSYAERKDELKKLRAETKK